MSILKKRTYYLVLVIAVGIEDEETDAAVVGNDGPRFSAYHQ